MEIRTLEPSEREAWLTLLDGWELEDGWTGRDFFRRPIDCDPTYVDENVWVAVEDGELVSCVQIFPRRIRLLGHPVPTGGIGSVFTRPDRRGGGLSGAVLDSAIEAMTGRGMELALLFSGVATLYEKHGFATWKTQRTLVQPAAPDARPPADARGAVDDPGPPVEAGTFDADRDLEQVKAIHRRYSHSRSGTVVRDEALWRASLALAGNPVEDFRVARRGDEVVAYLRSASFLGHLVVTEFGRRDDAPGALARLVEEQLQPRADDPLATPSRPSEELRARLLLPAFDDLQLTLALEQHGVASHPIDDPTAMLRCLDPKALSDRLGAPLRPGEPPAAFLRRVLPPDTLVFWTADRF